MADTQEKKACPCCGKHTDRSEKERRKLINRLKRVEGQIRGIIGMLENDAYCNDILIQSAAVNAAVNAFNKELLANHIRTCVARDIREGKDETIDELVTTLQKLIFTIHSWYLRRLCIRIMKQRTGNRAADVIFLPVCTVII